MFPFVLAVLGIAALILNNRSPVLPRDILLLVVSLAIPGVGPGWIRGFTYKIWHVGNQMMRKGTLLNLILWFVVLGIHIWILSFGNENAAGANVLLYSY
ncbi:hypothetical protein [Heyndrickxia vini]|uniref:hypothetical protein n=1 Tax=Heyndrickxia vini TaxID=1476025 RepID=UPI001BC8D3F5|nr:hypothetical protein [Heyndrickxia vini]